MSTIVTLEDYTLEAQLQYENHPLILNMQGLIDYTEYIIGYSELVISFPEITEEMIDSIESVLNYAIDIKTMYQDALIKDDFDELLAREDDIFAEIEHISYSLTLCEFGLDRFLILSQTHPEIKSVFLFDGFPIFSAANC